VLVPVLIDLLIGLGLVYELDFPYGKIYRGGLYLFGVLLMLKELKLNFYFIVFAVWISLLLFFYMHNPNFNMVRELTFFFKATYLFSIVEIIKRAGKYIDQRVNISNIIYRYAQLVSIAILFSLITGIGLETYGDWVFGTSSFFVSQNDIGITQLAVFTYLLFNKKNIGVKWVWLGLIFISLIALGTTAGMLGGILVILIYIFTKIFAARILSMTNLLLRIMSVGFLASISLLSTFLLFNYIKQSPYYLNKYEGIFTEGVRSRLTKAGDLYFDSRGSLKNIIGEGFSSFTYNFGIHSSEIKQSKKFYQDWLLVETDPYDFYGSYGLVLSLILLVYYIFYLLLAGINYYNKRDSYTFSLLLIIMMIMAHGIVAGHVFYSPTVLGVLAAFIYLTRKTYTT